MKKSEIIGKLMFGAKSQKFKKFYSLKMLINTIFLQDCRDNLAFWKNTLRLTGIKLRDLQKNGYVAGTIN